MLNQFNNVTTEQRGRVGLITLNRPNGMNVLNDALTTEIIQALKAFDWNSNIGAIVITGSNKAFAAGADIKEMMDMDQISISNSSKFQNWNELTMTKKPIIAAVNGFALGGGCELAMACDIILAGNNAKFGQPEIKLGTMPGLGGTQLLSRLVGKSRAMELCLTGEIIDANTAESFGLVSRVVPEAQLVDEAVALGEKISSYSSHVVEKIKRSINYSQQSQLDQGLEFERELFYSTFGTDDQREGMKAFIEKRPPAWKHS